MHYDRSEFESRHIFADSGCVELLLGQIGVLFFRIVDGQAAVKCCPEDWLVVSAGLEVAEIDASSAAVEQVARIAWNNSQSESHKMIINLVGF